MNEKYSLNAKSKVKKVIAIVSGKGGVGKSSTTALLASSMQRQGLNVGILDADITGSSMSKVFGISDKAKGSSNLIYPASSKTGIKIISTNMLLDNDEAPVVWRGPMITSLIRQFFEETLWEDLDYLLIDMPPGTGDVSLTVLKSLPVDGVIILTTPQELVSMIVAKAINMVNMLNVNTIGIIENMSYVECNCCDNKIQIFGESHVEDVSLKYGIKVLAKLPFNNNIASFSDVGNIEDVRIDVIDEIVKDNFI